jgi:N-acetylglucosaminyl-diphospho-decaprenol L-rhamnosyltransferase
LSPTAASDGYPVPVPAPRHTATQPNPKTNDADAPPVVRVVIVTYSPGHYLDRCITSLRQACSLPYEVVLADNGSTDGAPEQAVRRHGVSVVSTHANIGYGAAANAGSQGAAAEFLLICNPDIEFRPAAIDELLKAATRWPDGASFGPAILEEDGRLYPSARALPVVAHGIGHALLARIWPSNPWTRRYRREDIAVEERAAGWLSGSCILVRRDAFEQVGGFDPGYFMYFEDVDLGDRLASAGWRNVYVPTAQVTHAGGTTTQRYPRRMLKAHHDSAYRYLGGKYRPPLRWAIAVGLKIRYLVLAARAGRDD